jgi:hypothetical protein
MRSASSLVILCNLPLLVILHMLIDDMAGLVHPVKPPLAFDFDVHVESMRVDLRIAHFTLPIVHSYRALASTLRLCTSTLSATSNSRTYSWMNCEQGYAATLSRLLSGLCLPLVLHVIIALCTTFQKRVVPIQACPPFFWLLLRLICCTPCLHSFSWLPLQDDGTERW